MYSILQSAAPVIKDLDAFSNIESLLLKVIVPLLVSFLVAGFIGLERQNIGKAAGISSHILVSLSACGIAIFQRLLFDWQIEQAFLNIDVRPEGQRVIAQVLTGVGFIGAGVILKDQHNIIKGLTTAATIWSVAMVGIILGSGYLLTGTLLGVIICIFILSRDLHRGINPFISIDLQKNRIKRDKDNHYD